MLRVSGKKSMGKAWEEILAKIRFDFLTKFSTVAVSTVLFNRSATSV
jgi:hypothetical protein